MIMIIILQGNVDLFKKYKETLTMETVDIINSDGDYRNEMWTKESKKHKQNDSDVDLNDEKCYLKSQKNYSIEYDTNFT